MSSKDTERNFADKKCPALHDLIETFNYSDVYRLLHPDGEEYTFFRPSCAASRLDRFYAPPGLIQGVRSVTHNASLSDHKYVCMLISLPALSLTAPPPKITYVQNLA